MYFELFGAGARYRLKTWSFPVIPGLFWTEICAALHIAAPRRGVGSLPMGSRYYAHFIADSPSVAQAGEWSGIVELTRPLSQRAEERELSQVLAGSMDLQAEEIRILDWAWLH